MSITSPLARPSPNGRRVGIRIVTFEACSGFTRVTARRIAQLPKATFVTRLQPLRLPARAARQLPDQSTTLWVESSSTSDARLRGALPTTDIPTKAIPARQHHRKGMNYQPYSISSARSLSDLGTVNLIASAVLRLITSSRLVGSDSGMSAGFSFLSNKIRAA